MLVDMSLSNATRDDCGFCPKSAVMLSRTSPGSTVVRFASADSGGCVDEGGVIKIKLSALQILNPNERVALLCIVPSPSP